MNWLQLGYGVALTVVVGAVLALCAQWRDRRETRVAPAERLRLDAHPPAARCSSRPPASRPKDRAA